MRRYSFHKGHGTKNDFIILDDSYGMHDMHPEFIAMLCDRHAGVGADGVIRVVRASSESGLSQCLAAGEIVLSLVFFCATVAYARLTRRSNLA